MNDCDPVSGDSEGLSLGRREYLCAAGLITGSAGVGTFTEPIRGATSDIDPYLASIAVDQNWKTVELPRSFAEPVAIAGPFSFEGPEPCHVRFRGVTSDSVELALEEWAYQDGRHWDETTSCLVVESGRYSLDNGSEVIAGTTESDHEWTSVSFPSSFSSTPVVFSNAQTVNDPQPIVTRQKNVSESSFSVRVQEEEANGSHRQERIGYLAVEPGTGTLGGRPFEIGRQGGVSDEWTGLTFDNTYQDPLLFVDAQTFNGPNTCSVRYRNLTTSDVELKIEEERSKDDEIGHLDERVGYFVIEGDADAEETGGGSGGDDTDGFGVEEFGTGGFGT